MGLAGELIEAEDFGGGKGAVVDANMWKQTLHTYFGGHITPSCLQIPRAVAMNKTVCRGIEVCAPVKRFR